MSTYDTSGLERVMHLKLGAIKAASRAQARENVRGSMGVYYSDKTMMDNGISHYYDSLPSSRSVHGDL